MLRNLVDLTRCQVLLLLSQDFSALWARAVRSALGLFKFNKHFSSLCASEVGLEPTEPGLVLVAGVEPACIKRRILSALCLPIPPHEYYNTVFHSCAEKFNDARTSPRLTSVTPESWRTQHPHP